ncbi:MAG TPA: hypothetical protein VEW48_14330 [Thermoanaerobaculia bacterium]|nr:hypothetical protein [Thermoanaerobaculia bacterium]
MASYADDQKKMEIRNEAVAANAPDLPHLEIKRLRLNDVLNVLRTLTTEQKSLTARKQEVSLRLAGLMREGNSLVAFIDLGVKQHYGNRAEKLAEFGLQPFRGRPRNKPEPEEEPPVE